MRKFTTQKTYPEKPNKMRSKEKTRLHVCIDPDVLREAKAAGVNLSAAAAWGVREVLETMKGHELTVLERMVRLEKDVRFLMTKIAQLNEEIYGKND